MKIKKIAGVLVLAGLLSPMLASAQDNRLGVYVTPKFVYGKSKLRNIYTEIDGVRDPETGNVSDNSFGGSLAVGYNFKPNQNIPVRAEIEIASLSKAEGTWRDTHVTVKYSQRAQTVFLNAYYDIETGSKLTPYVGAGIGMAFIKVKGAGDDVDFGHFTLNSKNSTNFAWNLGIGLGYEITKNLTLDIGYRYVQLGKAVSNLTENLDSEMVRIGSGTMRQHQIGAGLRISF